ncbi:butyrophilin-like protein 8 [Scomber scombrus]|uniref:Butyrophilin-like protein 8 n=1 Tax=Scomber scombrus TaxID=13677 RepID=A0AAV1QBU3_SCOSC
MKGMLESGGFVSLKCEEKHFRVKMICRILLLISLTSGVSGTFVVKVTQSSYQAEENHNITLEWTFTTKPDSSSTSLNIYCEMFTDHNDPVLYHVHEGVEVPESQDEHFAGRVQSDKDGLREGRIRLHVSRLRTEDSGLYVCDVKTNDGVSSDRCRLNVTAERNQQDESVRKISINTFEFFIAAYYDCQYAAMSCNPLKLDSIMVAGVRVQSVDSIKIIRCIKTQ